MNDAYDDRPDETRWQLMRTLALDAIACALLFMLAVSMAVGRFLRRR